MDVAFYTTRRYIFIANVMVFLPLKISTLSKTSGISCTLVVVVGCRCVFCDYTPQLCTVIGCGPCNHLHLLQREVRLNRMKITRVCGYNDKYLSVVVRDYSGLVNQWL